MTAKKKGSLLHEAPAIAGSGEGQIICSLIPMCQEAISVFHTRDLQVTVEQPNIFTLFA